MAVDIIIGIILISGALLGWRTGFFREVSSKAGYLIGTLVAFLFTVRLSQLLYVKTPVAMNLFIVTFLIYLLLFLTGLFVMKGIGAAVAGLFEAIGLKVIDNILGLLLGLVEFIFVVSILAMAVKAQDFIKISKYIDESFIYQNVLVRALSVLSSVWQWIKSIVL